MPATVQPQLPGELGRTQIQSGAPIRGVTWSAAARALNHLSGQHRTLIPHCAPNIELSLTARAIEFRVFRSYQATHRRWVIGLGSALDRDDQLFGAELAFTDPSGGVSLLDCDASVGGQQVFEHIETVSSRAAGEATLSPTFQSTKGGFHVLTQLACSELPRPDLAINASDFGLELASFRAGHQIYDTTGRSIGALPEALAAALSRGRRHLFQWGRVSAVDASYGALTASTSAWTNLFPANPVLLERFLYAGDDWASCPWRLRAWCDVGTAGEVRITTATGDVSTIAVTAASPTWHSGSIDVHTENLATSDGRRASTWYTAAIEARRTSGAGSVYVSGVGIFGRAS